MSADGQRSGPGLDPFGPLEGVVLQSALGAVTASSAFVCFATDAPAALHVARVVDGAPSSADVARSIDEVSGVAASELASLERGPVFSAGARALVLALRDGRGTRGVVGVARRPHEAPFESGDAAALRALAPVLASAAAAHEEIASLHRRLAALRSLGGVTGTVFVVDTARGRVLDRSTAAGEADDDVDSRTEAAVVEAARATLAARALGLPAPLAPRLQGARTLTVAPIEGPGGAARYAAVRVELAPARSKETRALSPREQEIARLVVAGYSNVNIAAICGLSQNTIRTHMRRLHTKLRISNRAELVREVLTMQP